MKILSLSAIVLTLSACGTLMNGSSQDIHFDSNVKGVQIVIDGMKVCKTPCVYTMERRASPVTVMAQKPGYEDQSAVLKSELSKKSIFNLFFWPSWLTDLFTGGMWQYSRSGVYIEMAGGAPATRQYYEPYQSVPRYQQQRGYQYQRGYYDRYSANGVNDTAVRRFNLYNYGELKAEAMSGKSGEYIKSLAALSGKDEADLIQTINNSTGEVNLAHTLTGIE